MTLSYILLTSISIIFIFYIIMNKLFLVIATFLFLVTGISESAYAGFSGGVPTTQQSIKPSANTISKAEAKTMKKGLKQSLRNLADDNKMLAAVIAFFIPPLGVLLYENDLTTHFWISLILTLLFWLPGFIYALWVIFKS